MSAKPVSPGFPSLLQDFFCQCLIDQSNASARTVASYRDAFRLLLRYAEKRMHKPPVALTLADLDAPLILGFLDHLEKDRGNSARSRNARLVAVRSFLHYASHRDPTALPAVQRVLAIPMKRFDQPLLGFLSRDEMEAVLEAPDRTTWSGRRDHVMLTTFYNTGARVSEITALRVADVELGRSASIHLLGKGRKQRVTPLWRGTAKLLGDWLTRVRPDADAPLFPNRDGQALSRAGVEAAPTGGRRTCQKTLPIAAKPSHLSSYAQTHHGDASAPGGRGHHRHSPVAGSREPRDDASLHRSRSCHEGAGPRVAPGAIRSES